MLLVVPGFRWTIDEAIVISWLSEVGLGGGGQPNRRRCSLEVTRLRKKTFFQLSGLVRDSSSLPPSSFEELQASTSSSKKEEELSEFE